MWEICATCGGTCEHHKTRLAPMTSNARQVPGREQFECSHDLTARYPEEVLSVFTSSATPDTLAPTQMASVSMGSLWQCVRSMWRSARG